MNVEQVNKDLKGELKKNVYKNIKVTNYFSFIIIKGLVVDNSFLDLLYLNWIIYISLLGFEM